MYEQLNKKRKVNTPHPVCDFFPQTTSEIIPETLEENIGAKLSWKLS